MSWFFGISKSANYSNSISGSIDFHTEVKYSVSLPNLYLVFGGIEETCLFELTDDVKKSGWAVVGLGIQVNEIGARLLGKSDWREILSERKPQTNKLDGHFIALRWNKEGIELFSDQLGLGTAYYSICDEAVYFSTRMDWISRATKRYDLNFASVGSRWFLFNQLSFNSCVKGIERIGPNANTVIKGNVIVTNESHPWLPEFGNDSADNAIKILESLVNASANCDNIVSLGLSGGFDSRTILAILATMNSDKFVLHTFGHPLDPDVRIAKKIAHELELKLQYFNDPFPDPQSLVAIIQDFVAQNLLVEPASSILRLRYYSQQYAKGQMIIDGGFGELSRRQYMNRIVRFGKQALQTYDIEKLLIFMRVSRADIFNPEYTKELEVAASHDLETTLRQMPPISEIEVENFVDLFSVRTRVPNFGGPEQTRSDSYIVNFMPMVQPSYLKAVFKTDLNERKKGQFFRRIIKNHNKHLQHFPLVKSGTTYPFGFSSLTAKVFTKTKNRFRHPFTDPIPDQFLLHLREYVLDLVHSNDVKDWSGYDYKKVLTSVNSYYKGEHHLRPFVDWWLTFELWRRSLLGWQ
jgi:hypothetical protein